MIGKLKRIVSLLFLLSTLFSIAAAQEGGAVMRFTVLDEKDIFYPDLKSSDVRILRDKRPLEIVSFAPKPESSLEILILIDASLSQERTLPDEKRAAEYFIDHILRQGKDKVAIVSFTGNISMRKDLTSDLAGAKEELGKIEFEPPADYLGHGVVARPVFRKDSPFKDPLGALGASSIWDSISKASNALARVKSDAAKAIIVITDGRDNYGDMELRECVALTVKNRIPVYSIGIGDDVYGVVREGILKKLSAQTGGVSIVPAKKLDDLGGLIAKIGQALRFGYEIGVAPALSRPDALTETRIEIVDPQLRKRLRIIQPKGVFLPE
jgi:VWFA-related protein